MIDRHVMNIDRLSTKPEVFIIESLNPDDEGNGRPD